MNEYGDEWINIFLLYGYQMRFNFDPIEWIDNKKNFTVIDWH